MNMNITMDTVIETKNAAIERFMADLEDFDNGLTTAKEVVVDSVVEGSKELVRDASKIGLIVGVGVFGYFNGFGEVIMKQFDEAKRLGKYLENLADDLYLK